MYLFIGISQLKTIRELVWIWFKGIAFFPWSFWFFKKQNHHQQKLSPLSQIASWVRVLEEAVFKDAKMKGMKL